MDTMKYLVGSTENGCVFTMVRSPVVANALVRGGLDFWFRGIAFNNQKDLYQQITGPGLFEKNIFKLENAVLRPMEEKNISRYWLNMRRIMAERRLLYNFWEWLTVNALEKAERFHCEGFQRIMEKQITLCDLDQEIYTPMVEYYARTLDLEPKQVCKDLKFQIENDEFTKIKITAMAERWVRIINDTTDIEKLKSLHGQLKQDYFGNANL